MPLNLTRALNVCGRAASLLGARSGNVTIMFAFSLIPLIGPVSYTHLTLPTTPYV